LVEKRYSHIRAERIFTQNRQVAIIVRSINSILGLLLDAELSKIVKPSPDDRRGYEEAIALQRKTYHDFGVAFQNAKVLTNIYADLPCDLNEKPCRIFEIDKTILAVSFSECYYSDNEKLTETDLALTKYYYFAFEYQCVVTDRNSIGSCVGSGPRQLSIFFYGKYLIDAIFISYPNSHGYNLAVFCVLTDYIYSCW
jgi:hypothetical protein